MTILIITNLFYPDRGGGASVFSDLCFGLAERGHEIEVYTTYPYYPEWKNKSGANPWLVRRETWMGIKLSRYGLYIPRRPSALLQRIAHEISFASSLCRAMFRRPRFDLTLVYCPLMGAVLFAVVRKAVRGGPLWLNVQDIPADAASASGISKSRAFNYAASSLQRFLFRRADYISTISPIMVRRVRTILGSGKDVLFLPNWLNASMEELVERIARTRTWYTVDRLPVILYAGSIGMKQGLINCCSMIAALRVEFRFRIFGDGSEAELLNEWIKKRSDQRFSMGQFLPEEDFVRELCRADYFIITETPHVGASFIPSKLIPCIATGTPVIAICESEGPLGTEVREHGLGSVLTWDNMQNVAELLDSQFLRSQRYRDLTAACLRRAEVYRRKNAIDHFERQINAGKAR